ncbi:hypothetical protein BDW75DRAFT_203832 [Aspergillus navahoensis]
MHRLMSDRPPAAGNQAFPSLASAIGGCRRSESRARRWSSGRWQPRDRSLQDEELDQVMPCFCTGHIYPVGVA